MCHIGKHIKAAGSTKTIWGISGLCSLIFYPWHVKQLKTILSKSVFYQIILKAPSFEIPSSLLAPAHSASGLARADTSAQLGALQTQPPAAHKAQQHRHGFVVLPYCQKTRETTFIKKETP